jgi:neutral ceramidase
MSMDRREFLGSHGGGYETRLTSYSNLLPDAGRPMVEAGLELAARMKPGKIPEPAKAPPFQTPWSHGNVPPELS